MSDTEAKQGSALFESEAKKDAEGEADKASFVRRWLEAIQLSSEEEKDWRKVSAAARDVYEAAKDSLTGTAFNIYYANIETLRPALYNSTPVPDVRRRYGDRDPAAKEGADAIERCISYSIDDYDFDGTVKEAIDDLSITGRGVARVTYRADMVPLDIKDEQTGEPVMDVGSQTVSCETVPWASFRRGPARMWAGVPWVAFAHYMTRDELVDLNPEVGKVVPLNMSVSEGGEKTNDGANADNPESDVFKRALVWEIWDKAKRKVYFIAESYKVAPVTELDDPLGLRDFFPVPAPMMSGKVSGRLVPLSPYKIYKPILEEIDTITVRIKALVKQLRPRAIGPGGVDLDDWASADDGEIVEVTDVMKFLESGGMDKLLSWFPMEPTIKAVQELYARREQAKQELFEVSGLADIMRGQSNPNETKGAQDLKQRWGSLRLQKQQADIARFCRDLFRMKAEIIAEKYTPENIAAMTGLELSAPAIQMIKDEKMRNYRIDVETDSTIRGDLTRNQEAMAQFVQGSAQYFAAVAPIVQSGGMSKTAAVTIYSAFARNFKLGKEVDAVLDGLADEATKAEQAAQAQGPQPDPEMEKAKAEIQDKQARLQMDGEKLKSEQAFKMQDAQMARERMVEEFKLKREMAAMEFGLKQELAYADVALKSQQQQQQGALAVEQFKAKEKEGAMKAAQSGKAEQASMKGADQIAKSLSELGASIKEVGVALLQDKAQERAERSKPKSIKTPDGRVYSLS